MKSRSIILCLVFVAAVSSISLPNPCNIVRDNADAMINASKGCVPDSLLAKAKPEVSKAIGNFCTSRRRILGLIRNLGFFDQFKDAISGFVDEAKGAVTKTCKASVKGIIDKAISYNQKTIEEQLARAHLDKKAAKCIMDKVRPVLYKAGQDQC